MAESEDGVPNKEQQHQLTSPAAEPEVPLPAARSEDAQERAAEGGAAPSSYSALTVETTPLQFKLKRFFVLRVNYFTSLLCGQKTFC